MAEQEDKLKEALGRAIYREIGAGNIYKRLADTIKNPKGKEKFGQISRDEEAHRVKLESWFKKLFNEDFIIDAEELKHSEIEDIYIKELTGALGALDIAIEAESKAIGFYSDQAEGTDIPELKKLFSNLADEERGHYNLLQAERQSIIGGFYWFDMNSTLFMED